MKRVMIVDDDEQIRESASIVLAKQGNKVIAVTNGLECLDLVREGFKGVILMDVAMPLLDGWKTVRTLRDEGLLPGTLVCMLTGQEPSEDSSGLEECVFDYLRKPFSTDALIKLVAGARAYLEA
jgi:CheY-like chemotaxis protein